MKKLVIITSDLYVRNYLQTDALSQIEDENCYFLASDEVTLREPLQAKANFFGFFHYDAARTRNNMFMTNVLMLRHQNRSRTFSYRFRRMRENTWKQFSAEKLAQSKTYQHLSRVLPQPISHLLALQVARALKLLKLSTADRENIGIALLGRPGIAELYGQWFERAVKPSQDLENAIARLKPDVVIFPCLAIDPPGNDIVRLQKKLGYRSLFLIDNWDNLSSKSVFLHQPDYMAVWGQQSVEHAWEIHGLPAERVFPVGTPRFQHYFDTIKTIRSTGQNPESPYPFPYVLYVGCAIPFDELSSLKILDEVLKAINQHRTEPLRVVYRPHPWRQKRSCPDVLNLDDFSYVVLDEQLKEQYYQPQRSGLFQPSLAYYPKLLANAELVVGPLTTMLLEAAIFRKKILAIAYDDGVHLTTPHNALKYYRHFEGLTDMPGMRFSHRKANFGEDFMNWFNIAPEQVDWAGQSEKLGYYLFQDDQSYPERLKRVLDRIELIESQKSVN